MKTSHGTSSTYSSEMFRKMSTPSTPSIRSSVSGQNDKSRPANRAACQNNQRLELALFLDLCSLANAVTQVVELRTAHVALGHELDLGHDW